MTRAPLLWGDSVDVAIPILAPGVLELRQLINVEAPFPCTWNVLCNIAHPSGAGVEPDATTTLVLFINVGIGRVIQRVMFPFQRTVAPTGVLFTGQVQNLPAKSLVLNASLFSVVAGPATWKVSVWCAPTLPWEGMTVTAVPRPREGHELADAAQQQMLQRRIWR